MTDDPNLERDQAARDARRSAKLAAVRVLRQHGPMPISALARIVGVPAETMAHAIYEAWATFRTTNGRLARNRCVRLHPHLEVA